VLLRHLFLGLSHFLWPYGFHIRAASQSSKSSFHNMWPIQLNLRHLISILMFSWLVSFQSFSLEIVLTNHVSHPYNSTHFTHELNILIPVLLQM
jgi:hypothetical protein